MSLRPSGVECRAIEAIEAIEAEGAHVVGSVSTAAERPQQRQDLTPLLQARSVAIVGISGPDRFGGILFKNLTQFGYAGEVFGVNPRYQTLYDRAIAAGPEGPAPALAAVALVRETDAEEAARRLERLLDHHPRAASAANELAEILADRGKLDRARIYASRAAWFGLPEAEETFARIEKLRAAAPARSDLAPQDEPNE